MTTDPDPKDPTGLPAIHEDSQLLDTIGQDQRPHPTLISNPGNEALVEGLVEWRQAINAMPIPDLVSPDTAQDAIRSGRRRSRFWFRKWVRDVIRRRTQ